MQNIIYILLFSTIVYGQNYKLVISKKCNADKKLNFQKIYLKKQIKINNCDIVPLNLKAPNKIRKHFINDMLKISNQHWNRYWDKMHFKGVKAPHVVLSKKAMAAYITNMPGAIGYIPEDFVSPEMTILVSFELE
ncbi:hypothetical protein [Sulfurimonas sp.]|jgi:ABC-type phosphate transport system substrate-binding protein|uniref:hypothetical protein n=1 Tax=Sulfurimonas sp. TaxID=2022749 RepID=UPI0025D0F7E0|nr:hypothetical protein [Sulfurimonas sp.]MBT5933840.1 hypothetical protein [Sulfurimonas sp.]